MNDAVSLPFVSQARLYGAEAAALPQMAETLSDAFDQSVAPKMATMLASTDTPALLVHPAEASHGDPGMVAQEDVCILLSDSGETREPQNMVSYARRFFMPLIDASKRAVSTLIQQSDIAIGMAPTTSTACRLARGDSLALMNEHHISSLFVVDDDRRWIGKVRNHDCLRAGVA